MSDTTIRLPPWAKAFKKPATYKVAYGGRGSGKSWAFADMALLEAARRKIRILCARELQISIRDSVHRLLADRIDAIGLGTLFDVQRDTIRCKNGSEFIFRGLRHNATEIKSLENITITWVEEAQTVSKESWDLLVPTVLRNDDSQIWVTFNPDREEDATYQRFVADPPDSSIVARVNWDMNPWFPKLLDEERQYLARVDPDAYSNVWLGNCRTISEAQIMRGKFAVEAFEPELSWNGPYFGADWGFSADPTSLVKLWVHGRTLYVEHEAWGLQVDIDATPALFDLVPGSRQHIIRADSARPETISHMNKRGFNIHHAVKGKGSVEDGIAHLRSYERIVVHPRCAHTLHEMQHYSYKVDRLSGDVLPIVVDANNHCIDAMRYALEPLMGGRNIKKPKTEQVAREYDWGGTPGGWMA